MNVSVKGRKNVKSEVILIQDMLVVLFPRFAWNCDALKTLQGMQHFRFRYGHAHLQSFQDGVLVL